MKNTLSPIFVISLADAHQRGEHMRKMLDDLSLEYEFVDAVDGKLLTAEEIEKVYDKDYAQKVFGRGLSRGEMGCYMSHVKVMQIIQDRGLSSALVMEDDAFISPDIKPFLQNLAKLPPEWNIVHLAGAVANPDNLVVGWYRKSWRIYKDYEVGIPHGTIYGTQAYLVKRTFAEQFLPHAYPMDAAIDHKLFDIQISFSPYYALKGRKLAEHGVVVSDAEMFASKIGKDRGNLNKTADWNTRINRSDWQTTTFAGKFICRPFIYALRWLRGFCFRQAKRFLIYFFPPRKCDGRPILTRQDNLTSRVRIIRFLLALHLGLKGEGGK